MKIYSLLTLIALSLFFSKANAANPSPTLLPFQGRLSDANGTAVSNGTRLVQLKIYNVPAGGSPVWPGEIHRTTVNGGLVNVLLGSKVSLEKIDFSQTLYLEITVDVDGDNAITAADPPMLPRQMILPATFAKNSEKLAGYDWSSILADGSDPNKGKISGSKILSGSIGSEQIQNGSITQEKLAAGTLGLESLVPNLKDVLAVNYRNYIDRQMTGFIDAGALKTNLTTLKNLAGTNWDAAEYKNYKAYLNSLINSNWFPVPGTDYLVIDLSLQLKWIACGTFEMGSWGPEQDRAADEGNPTIVHISRGFWMGQFEVTQQQFQTLMNANPSQFKNSGNSEEDKQRPVESVSRASIMSFCSKLTDLERLANRLPEGYVYRLPTEAEWEYACRAGTKTRFWYGNDLDYSLLTKYAWYDGNASISGTIKTHPTGQKIPNSWGLYDMYGNVWEHCMDNYRDRYPGGEVTDYYNASGSYPVLRGGAYYHSASYCRSANRDYAANTGDAWVGFRVVLAFEVKMN